MQRIARVAASQPPSRLQVALAAAWLIASLVIGSIVGIESPAGPAAAPPPVSGAVANP